MKILRSAVVLLGCLALVIQAEPEPEPEPAKGRRSAFQSPKFRSSLSDENINQMVAELRQAESADAVDEKNVNVKATPDKADASSGRLFLRKFLLFRNIFGNSNTQPVIPIIITGAGTGAAAGTNPTTTITSTGSIPTATGTITTSPTGATTGGTTAATGGTTAIRGFEEAEEDDDAEAPEEAVALDEQTLQAALAAGAQEYVVTNEDKDTSDGKASKQPARVNLKRKGDKKGQTISVRIPAKYRRYFKNGQRVMLNTGNRPAKKRVVRKRVNKNRKRVSKNKNSNMRKRIIAA